MSLSNKIDFMCIIVADHCNPNGDPLNANRPRTNYDGYGEMTPECIKRKIRNRLQDMGENIFVQTEDKRKDDCKSLNERAIENLGKCTDVKTYTEDACKLWYDVRAFGQIFAYKEGKVRGEGVSIQIRGPVSITYAKTIERIDILDVGGTKSTNTVTKEDGKRDSTTFFVKDVIDHGVYVFSGSIYPQLAEKTGFTDEDAEKIKQALMTLFENDASSSRPSGSMAVGTLIWWKHPGKQSTCQPQKLFRSVKITPCEEYPFYTLDFENDYNAEIYDML